ncbi:WD40 repeat-like protein [Lentinula edodes]|nr:WD40 repeat-like protein [Lentinula edodes]
MIQTGLITSAHSDLLTCLAYDYYGANIASCGLDQKIVVTAVNVEQSSQSPTVKYEWRAHSAPITCVAWAHPEFGEVLASAGMDRTVRVWERGEEKAVLLDARAGVRQVEFGPAAFGLKVATVAADGWVRVYECLDLGKLDVWALADAVEVAREEQPGGGKEVEGGWGVSWCKERYWGQVVAAVAGASDVVKIIQFSPSRSPQTILELKPPPPPSSTTTTTPTTSVITTVAWAPSCGRSYHLIATGGRDGHVRIWKVSGPMVDSEEDDPEDRDLGDVDTSSKWSGQLVADFDDHARIGALEGGVVGKVEWNVTGTILSSSGSDGRVRLWKASLTSGGRIWRIAGSVGVEQKE